MQTYSNRNNLDHRTMAGSSEILHSHSELRSVAPDVVQGSNESLQKKKSTRKLASSLRTADTLASSSRINVRAKIGARRTSGRLPRSINKRSSNWNSAKADRCSTARSKSSKELSNDSGFDDNDNEDEDLSSNSPDEASEGSTQESSSTEDESAESDADSIGQPQNDESDSEQQSVFSKGIVVYFRLKVKSSSSKRSVIKEILRANHPNALILLEAAPENPRSTYSSRTMLNRLMNDVFDEKVKEIIIADFNHICTTKDGFQLFCWICDLFGTKVLISPALQLV